MRHSKFGSLRNIFCLFLASSTSYAARSLSVAVPAPFGSDSWTIRLVVSNPSTIAQTVTVTAKASGADARLKKRTSAEAGNSFECFDSASCTGATTTGLARCCKSVAGARVIPAGGSVAYYFYTDASNSDPAYTSGVILQFNVDENAGYVTAFGTAQFGGGSPPIIINGGRPF